MNENHSTYERGEFVFVTSLGGSLADSTLIPIEGERDGKGFVSTSWFEELDKTKKEVRIKAK
jgi:hypothetical protein